MTIKYILCRTNAKINKFAIPLNNEYICFFKTDET